MYIYNVTYIKTRRNIKEYLKSIYIKTVCVNMCIHTHLFLICSGSSEVWGSLFSALNIFMVKSNRSHNLFPILNYETYNQRKGNRHCSELPCSGSHSKWVISVPFHNQTTDMSITSEISTPEIVRKKIFKAMKGSV